jgi:hypothetical protein
LADFAEIRLNDIQRCVCQLAGVSHDGEVETGYPLQDE